MSQIVSVARNANNFFVGTNIKQHQMINSLFMREKAICITAVGMAKHLKKVWEELTEIRDTGDSGRNAKNAGIKSYYAQGRTWDNPYYNDSYWTGKKEYDGWDGCGICVSAMLLSYFDVDVTPAQILDGQGGNKDWGGRYIQKKCAEKEVTKTKRTNGSMTQAEKMEILDRWLDEFKRNPKHNAPPVVSMDKKSDGTPHYVIVVGRVVGKDGKTEKYIIVDSDDNGCTILNPYPEREKSVYGYYDSTDENNRHYNSPIKNVFQWTKR